jgi:hypothetical protein
MICASQRLPEAAPVSARARALIRAGLQLDDPSRFVTFLAGLAVSFAEKVTSRDTGSSLAYLDNAH